MRPILAPRKMKAALLNLVSAYLLILAGLFLVQEHLLYFPPRISEEYAAAVAVAANIEEVKFGTDDGVMLHGWLAGDPEGGKAPLLIYYGGNGEEVSRFAAQSGRFPGYAVLAMNYRGYGLSEGRPNERNLCRDAEKIYDLFADREDIDRERIIVMGRSIGTGVAVHIAACRPVHGVILVTPYDSLTRVVQAKVKVIPASLLLRNRFDSIAMAPRLDIPLLALIAGRDEVIPPAHAYNLTGKWGGAVTQVTLESAGHNDIQQDKSFWESIVAFLEGI
ncbi:MAG: alpha/beta hydrolase [bacterium]|jgi:pimeloyl-ACP methyl ester carboxylesterase